MNIAKLVLALETLGVWDALKKRPMGSGGGGGRGGGAVDSVNWQTGVVQLDTDDIPDVSGKRYLTEAERGKLNDTSGVNTGDQDLSDITRLVQISIADPSGTSPTVGNDKAVFLVPSELNGWNLTGVAAMVSTVSSSGLPTIMVRNATDAVDMLTTAITIDVSAFTSYTATTPPVIDTGVDDVATGDRIAIDLDVVGTGAKGHAVLLVFTKP